ncbi:DNA mismatch repair protein MutL [Gracilariopsis chorda]|uniref:DNA mismatch repair protein MutL n=1 Tax=Gracilariopsis chorda TaxID=448386 RepID=A0A2V3IY18_9FLOR|nr:DNA mismatch repair protein MutL [Gracilariopsis chorda]|eukprot:PXF46030.1 DNA mismatch repair protein MutL [Gracilariopsis chorda]
MASIKKLPSTASDLLSHALHLSTYEITVSNVLENVISAGFSNLTVTLNPSALRFKLVSTQPPSHSILPLLTTLSAQCSVEYHTPRHTTLLRGARVLDKHIHKTSAQELYILDVWEMFYSIPVRRRIQQARHEHEITCATRLQVMRIAFANPLVRIRLCTDNELPILSWDGDGLSSDAICAALGSKHLDLVPVQLRKDDIFITGFVSRLGLSSSVAQYASMDGDTNAGWLFAIMKTAWKRFLNCKRSADGEEEKLGRCPAFVLNCFTNKRKSRAYSKRDKATETARTIETHMLVEMFHVFNGIKKKRPTKRLRPESNDERSGLLVPKRLRFEEVKIQRKASIPVTTSRRFPLRTSVTSAAVLEQVIRKHAADWCNPTFQNSAALGLTGADWEKKAVAVHKTCLSGVHIVGQVDFKYIVVADEKGLYAVDQHAASERDLYESYLRKAIRGLQVVKCEAAVSLCEERKQLSTRLKKLLSRWGWDVSIEEEGVVVTGMPKICDTLMTQGHLFDFLDELCEDEMGIVSGCVPRFVRRTVATIACHKAVRFGDRLTCDQCESIIRALAKCDNPFCCAHGRPSIVPLAAFEC